MGIPSVCVKAPSESNALKRVMGVAPQCPYRGNSSPCGCLPIAESSARALVAELSRIDGALYRSFAKNFPTESKCLCGLTIEGETARLTILPESRSDLVPKGEARMKRPSLLIALFGM